MQVQSLLRGTKIPLAQGNWACIPQLEKPPCFSEKSMYHNKEPVQPKFKKKRKIIKTAKYLKKKS